jgi:hypothetical protein
MKETTARQKREEKKIWRVPVFSFEAFKAERKK